MSFPWARVYAVFVGLLVATSLLACGGDPPNETDADMLETSDPVCGEAVCGTDERCCDFACIAIDTDPDHCGGCGHMCADGQSCQAGLCSCGDAVCGGSETCCLEPAPMCLNLGTDTQNCGQCGVTCGATEQCLNGTCACLTADGSYESCGTDETCCPGQGCADLEFEPLNCGACGMECGAGELCIEGACGCGDIRNAQGPACAADEACCGSPGSCRAIDDPECACGSSLCGSGQSCCGVDGADTCVSTWREPQHCGGCGSLCATAQSCRGGTCLCQGGVADCNADMADGCEARLDLDASNCGGCGETCAAGEVCDGRGQCDLSCQLGLTDCDGSCVDLNWNRDNCGACNNACAPGEVANGAGQCALSCLAGLTDCSGECVSLPTNRAHCGTCGNVCAPGEVCDGGGRCALTCIAGLVDCAGSCVDLGANRAHCGACGTTCGSGEVCLSGACAPTCLPGTVECAGACVDVQASRLHCGGCGAACGPGELCEAGVCAVTCPADPNVTQCGAQCVDVGRDRRHCGGCDVGCAASQRCEQGACVSNCLDGFTLCDGQCVDLDTSSIHCGACNTACGAGDVCVTGSCCDAVTGCGVPPSISLSDDFACAVADGGAVYCWGDNPKGQLGIPGPAPQNTPVLTGIDGTSPGTRATSVTAGGNHVCALLESGDVACWGWNGWGQLGVGNTLDSVTPQIVAYPLGTPAALSVSAGQTHTCSLHADGRVRCWGYNTQGQVGDGTSLQRSTPVLVSQLANVMQVVAIGDTSCALLPIAGSTHVYCWGRSSGCGTDCPGSMFGPDLTQPVEDPGSPNQINNPLLDLVTLFPGEVPCGVRQDGSAWCWDIAGTSQMLDNPSNGVLGYSSFMRGRNTTGCGVTTAGQVACYGSNAGGKAGHLCTHEIGDCTDPIAQPGLVVDSAGDPISAVALAMGQDFSCAITPDGQIACWGFNGTGALGLGIGAEVAPTRVLLPSPADSISAGGTLNCATMPADGLACWGEAFSDAMLGGAVPVLVPNSLGAVASTQTYSAVCYIDSGGAAWCMGESYLLGDGCNPGAMPGAPDECLDTTTPSPVAGIDGVSARAIGLEAGWDHVCALLDDGTVRCWGSNYESQLGPAAMGDSTSPVQVTGLTDIVEVAAGDAHTCARTSTGAVWCWGQGWGGELGDNMATTSAVPVQVQGIDGVSMRAVDLGAGTANVAVLDDGTVWGWGYNSYFQLGPESPDLHVPRLIPGTGGGNMVVAADTHYHTCLLTGTGAAQCLGDNYRSALGIPEDQVTVTELVTPVPGLMGSPMLQSLAVAESQTCALSSAGEVWCWGDGELGQRGDGSAWVPWAEHFRLP